LSQNRSDPHLDSQSENDSINSTDEPIAPVVNMFEDDKSPDIPESLLQDRKPEVGDSISFYNDELKTWKEAIITHDLSRRWENYYNIQYSDGTKDGLYLNPDTRWTFLTTVSGQPVTIGSTRKSCTFLSLQPSPKSPLDPLRVYSSQSDLNVRNASQNLTNFSADLSIASSIGILDKSKATSMEWDLSYLELQPSISDFANSPCRNMPERPIDNTKVNDLALYLPLSSTPTLPRKRLAQARRSLPLEQDNRIKNNLQTFLQRFIPFRKKPP